MIFFLGKKKLKRKEFRGEKNTKKQLTCLEIKNKKKRKKCSSNNNTFKSSCLCFYFNALLNLYTTIGCKQQRVRLSDDKTCSHALCVFTVCLDHVCVQVRPAIKQKRLEKKAIVNRTLWPAPWWRDILLFGVSGPHLQLPDSSMKYGSKKKKKDGLKIIIHKLRITMKHLKNCII